MILQVSFVKISTKNCQKFHLAIKVSTLIIHQYNVIKKIILVPLLAVF